MHKVKHVFMIENYSHMSEDLSDSAKSAICHLETKDESHEVVARHIKNISINGGENASDEFVIEQAQKMRKASALFIGRVGGMEKLKKSALDSPLPVDEQKELVKFYSGKVDEILIISLLDVISAEGPGEWSEMISQKVVGGVYLRDISPTLLGVLAGEKIIMRIRGWIPDHVFSVEPVE